MRETKEMRLEQLLNQLQKDIERCPGTPDARGRRRTVLRGIRAAVWALGSNPQLTVEEIEAELRSELFSKDGAVPAHHAR